MSTSDAIDLSQIAMVDNHAHALAHRQPDDAPSFRANFSEAHDSALARDHVGWSVQYRWALRQITSALNLPPDEDAFLAHRRSADLRTYARRLVRDAHLSCILLDEGYPPPGLAYTSSEMEDLLGVRIGRILRIETTLEGLMAQCTTLAQLESRFDAALDNAWNAGFVAIKSIAAYRTGLAIEQVREWEVMRAFADARRGRETPFRLASKPLIDHFVRSALRFAAHHAMPFQFHTGYGDPDLDLRLANPLHLRPLFEERAFVNAPIVLLHESFPFTAEAAYLAAAYPNAYVDVAFSLPPLDRGLLCNALRTVLGTAPVSKVLCSSDGTMIPEHYWLGAVRARLCLSEVLGEMVDAGELDTTEAVSFARMALHDNAMHIYHL
ncbi:MAG: amidohydrolase family protein [Chloroflexota bacterium]